VGGLREMPTTGLPHNRPAGARHRRPPLLGITQRDRWLGRTELFRPLRSDGIGAIGRSSLASTLAIRPRNTYANLRVNGRTDPEVDQPTAHLRFHWQARQALDARSHVARLHRRIVAVRRPASEVEAPSL
jgi:hypothetical protein